VTRRNRVWSIAALTVGALASVSVLSACGAGQITATANMVSAIQGVNATATVSSDDPNWDGATVGVRNVQVDNNGVGYPAGGTAPLTVYIVNNTPAPLTLVGVTATFDTPGTGVSGTATVVLTGGPQPSAPPVLAPSPAATPSGSAKPGASASATESPSPVVTTPPPVGNATINVTVPQAPAPLTQLTRANGTYLQLDKLSAPMSPGAIVHLVFTFKLGDDKGPLTLGDNPAQPVDAPFGPPTSPAPRVPLSLSPVEQ
jgi:hypothetical protein